MHEGVKRFKCPLCDYGHYEKNSVISHVKLTHPEVTRVKDVIGKINWRTSITKTIGDVDTKQLGDPLYVGTGINRSIEIKPMDDGTEQQLPASRRSKTFEQSKKWNCKICKNEVNLAGRDSHLMNLHNMDLKEYLITQTLSKHVNTSSSKHVSMEQIDEMIAKSNLPNGVEDTSFFWPSVGQG